MRIALILLSIVALLFIGMISWNLMKSDAWWPPTKPVQVQWTDVEILKYQIKTDEKIKQLEQTVEAISKKTGSENVQNTNTETGTPSAAVIISGKFLAKVMPTLTLTLTENNGIFWLYTFDVNTHYSTYEDAKFAIKVIPTSMSYDSFLKNMRALGKDVYTVNETSGFPTRSFYVNPPKSDTLVRLVTESESQSIAIEVSKSKFQIFKNLLLEKNITSTKKK